MIASRLSRGEIEKALCAYDPLKGLHPVFLAPGLPSPTFPRGREASDFDGRSSGSPARRAAFPPRLAARQWRWFCPKRVPRAGSALRRDYSGGTASDFHGIPCWAFRHRLILYKIRENRRSCQVAAARRSGLCQSKSLCHFFAQCHRFPPIFSTADSSLTFGMTRENSSVK